MHISKESGSRMCWHCEGYVAVHLSQCPYCQAFLQEPTYGCGFNKSEDSRNEGISEPFAIPSHWSNSLEDFKSEESAVNGVPFVSKESLLLALLFFGMGMVTFGLFVTLFGGSDGLTLTWSRSRAFYCILIGIPLIYKGVKTRTDCGKTTPIDGLEP